MEIEGDSLTVTWEDEEKMRQIRRERDIFFQIRMMDWLIWFFVGCLVLIGLLLMVGLFLAVAGTMERMIG